MKRSTSTRIGYLYSALLIAVVMAQLCVAPIAFGRPGAQSRQDSESFSNTANGFHSQALINAPRAHSHVPASKQKRVRHPALDFAALPPERFHLIAGTLVQRSVHCNRLFFPSYILARPRGRAPPVSV
jgi:hypothetical protein